MSEVSFVKYKLINYLLIFRRQTAIERPIFVIINLFSFEFFNLIIC